MLKHNKIKLSIMVIAITILVTSVLITNPAKTAFGQGTIDDILGLNVTQDNMKQGNMSGGNMSGGNMSGGNMSGGNMTGGNMTAVIDVDTLTQNIKERHPILAQMAADEDQDLMMKIKDMDTKEAAKTTIALNMLRLLQQYKQLDVE
jgi:pentapeptide MXKDX repeat protein